MSTNHRHTPECYSEGCKFGGAIVARKPVREKSAVNENPNARHEHPMLTHPEYRRKQRDRFAVATLGSGLLGKMDPRDAVAAMFDIAEQMMAESERRYKFDVAILGKKERANADQRVSGVGRQRGRANQLPEVDGRRDGEGHQDDGAGPVGRSAVGGDWQDAHPARDDGVSA